ncbi:hypothetical protein [Halegenticoccus soli]|uniref:hypothetical protein n=1 Tax=Halegenticoccus soli TaxID=1985678 RepID=UPI000C6D1818|nr:hypothetical protein [Halegenticoccus soli]
MALSVGGWISLLGSVAVLWGTATWALYRSLRDEDRKLELLEKQGEIDTYSPQALAELREWIRANPDDPLAEETRRRHNECVEILKRIDEPFYGWERRDVEALEKVEEA